MGYRAEGTLLLSGDKGEYKGDRLFERVLFQSGDITLEFNRNGGHMTFNEDQDIFDAGRVAFFYPGVNEVSVSISSSPGRIENTEREIDGVSVDVLTAGEDMFVRGRSEVTAYSPNYLVVNGDVYEYRTFISEEYLEGDEFLGVSGGNPDEVFYVENVKTGFRTLMDCEEIEGMVGGDNNYNGAIPVHYPENLAEFLTGILK